jgi:hypothetical protein
MQDQEHHKARNPSQRHHRIEADDSQPEKVRKRQVPEQAPLVSVRDDVAAEGEKEVHRQIGVPKQAAPVRQQADMVGYDRQRRDPAQTIERR